MLLFNGSVSLTVLSVQAVLETWNPFLTSEVDSMEPQSAEPSMRSRIGSLEELRTVNSPLADAVSQVHERHHPFLLSVYDYYKILVDLGYFNEEELQRPPHPQEMLSPQAWQRDGLDDEVVSLLPLLPYPSRAYVGEITLEASPLSYLGEPDLDVRDPRFTGDPADRISTHILPFTVGGHDHLYNVNDGALADWQSQVSSGGFDAQALDWGPAHIVINEWLENVRNLTWVCDRFYTAPGPIIEVEPPPQLSTRPWTYPSGWSKNVINSVRARRKIYREHGWPGLEYRRDECQQALQAFHTEIQSLDAAIRAALRPFVDEETVYNPESQRKPAEAYTRFLEDAAGDEAETEGGLL